MADQTLSVVIPVLNEMAHVPALLEGLERQTRRPDEVIVVDGGSTDGTREWLVAATAQRPWLKVIENPEQWVPAAMNRGILASTGTLVARMDGHARYADDYLERLEATLSEQPDASGVGGVYVMSGFGPWGSAIAAVLSSPIALGGAPHRRARRPMWVSHVGTGMYRRQALVEVHGFDPTFRVNEDFELDHRLGLAGHRIWLEPAATFTSYSRSGPGQLGRQMLRYGSYKARTLLRHPDSVHVRQLAPPVLIAAVAISAGIDRRAGATLLATYLTAAGASGAWVARRAGASPLRGAVALPLIHWCWGTGLYVGLLRHRRSAAPESPGGPRP